MSGKPSIVGICQFRYGTGLTRVMSTVMAGLSRDYEIHYLGIGYSGPVIDRGGVRVYPTNPEGGDVFASLQARELIRDIRPAAVFILQDIWNFRIYREILAPVRHLTKFVGYLPLDGSILDASIAEPLRGLDCVVVYTDWAKEQLDGALGSLAARPDAPPLYPPVRVIGHGTDDAEFRPEPALLAVDFHSSGRAAAKRTVFPDLGNPEDSFIALNANSPSERKRIDVTVEAFARFAHDKPDDVRLCLHQAMAARDGSDWIESARKRLGDRLIVNPLSPGGGPLSEEDLNLLYNACDVGINTASGEGWGLVSFEHAAAGAAQVVPRHSACGALWSDENAEMVEPVERRRSSYSPLEMAFVDADGVAATLEKLYRDRERLRAKSKAAFRHATRAEFTWDPVIEKWRRVLEEMRTPETFKSGGA